MQYYSTNNKSIVADFRQATIEGQPTDKGLYFPSYIPQLSQLFFEKLPQLSKTEIALEVIRPYVGETIDEAALMKIIEETIGFVFPLINIKDNIYTLELFHGPTLAFKDVGARFMSRCLGYFSRDEKRKTTVLVATSGDTGGAVAHAFYEVENVDVVILYPSGKVSEIQERQLTTLGKNISAIEIHGSFDDCQRMVKEAFTDRELNTKMLLTSANSINVARWLPQQFYYFYAHQQWKQEQPPVVCVPSGNFGNICAGILAHLSGLPVKQFVAACNANDVVSNYLTTGTMSPKPSVATISNAMDVGNPSNFVRILHLFQEEHAAVKKIMTSYTISDEETLQTVREVKQQTSYLLDPHGAVGYASLQRYFENDRSGSGYFLETAHPVKFDLDKLTEETVALPGVIQQLMMKEKKKVKMKAETAALKEFLLAR